MSMLPQIQFQMVRNKYYIQTLEQHIKECRRAKTLADIEGNLEDEYAYHNALKSARKELKGMVKVQQVLKQMCKKGG